MQTRSLVIEEVSEVQKGPHVLRLSGPLILTTLPEFQSKVRADRSNNLILDLTGVPYVDSAGKALAPSKEYIISQAMVVAIPARTF